MNDVESTDLDNSFQKLTGTPLPVDLDVKATPKQRNRPGPQKKENPRSEKISCRLSKKERDYGSVYCEANGITEARLLRASYLSTITETKDDRIERVVDALIKEPLNAMNLSPRQKLAIKLNAKHMLKKSAVALLLILLGAAMTPGMNKYFDIVDSSHELVILNKNDQCIQHPGITACEIIRR